MKQSIIKRLSVLVLAIAVILPASAQFSIGPRVGVCVNKFDIDESMFDSSNRAGFCGGLQMELMIPMLSVGVDLSAMYVHRSIEGANDDINRDYIEIPLNLKWKIGLPIVNNIVTPYIFTGPSFAFLTSKEEISEFFKSKKCDIAWNVGVGVQLFKHLQVGASYGFGLTKAVEFVGNHQSADIDGKNKYWTVTAAWLF